MPDSENTLVRYAQRGDRPAFYELVRRTSRLVYARLYLDTGDAHAAEDLLQETLLTAYKTLGQLTDPDKFRAWLLRIAQNAMIDAARHNSRQKRTPDLAAKPKECEEPPDVLAEKEEMRQKVLT